jgi:hypothetical protein
MYWIGLPVLSLIRCNNLMFRRIAGMLYCSTAPGFALLIAFAIRVTRRMSQPAIFRISFC